MARTQIEWCDFSVNPVRAVLPDGAQGHACVKWGPDCEHCYAERINMKFGTLRAFTKEATAGIRFVVNEKALHEMARMELEGQVPQVMLDDHPPEPKPTIAEGNQDGMYG